MRSRQVRFGTAAALVMAIVTAGVMPAEAQKRGGTLRVAYGNEISNFDFHTAPGYELGVGRAEHRLRAHQHHARRQVHPGRRRVVADLARRPPLHVPAQEECAVPRRHAARRRGGQVQRRAPHGPRHPVEHADVLRVGALRRGDRSVHRADPAQVSLRLHAAHAGRVPHGPHVLLAGGRPKVHPGGAQGGQTGGRPRVRAVQARGVGEGEPPGAGPLRQVLRAGPALSRSHRHPGDQGPRHPAGRLQGR
jgi:hypothetical protein